MSQQYRYEVTLPSGKRVGSNDLIYPESNFNWGEATKGLSRMPQTLSIENKIIYSARKLDVIRQVLGGMPIYINSWYRPKKINEQVGGSIYSRHLYGDGVDFHCKHLSPAEIFNILHDKHNTGGLKNYISWVHIDFRGHRARW